MTALRSDQVSDGHPQESSGPSVELSKEARGSQSGVDHEAQLDPIALPDKIPDGGYGWVVMSCIVGINAVTWGANTTYGVYSAYYLQNNYFDGGSTFRYAWVGGLSVATALICGPLANYLSRRFHFRVPMTIGIIGIVLGQCLAGISRSFAAFLVCQGVVFGIGLGMTMVPYQPLLSHWFDKRLALAQGIAGAGSGLGGLVLANTTRVALESVGVKWALVINGLISLVVLVPCVALLRSRNKAVGARYAPFQISFVAHKGFCWVLLWGAFSMIAYFVALYSLASFATSGLGLSQTKGAALQSVLAAGQMIGRPAWGQLLDKGGKINMTLICYLIAGGSCLAIWLPSKSFGVLIFFALVQGLTGGTIWSVAAPITRAIVGVKDLASALNIFWLATSIPALVAQPIAVALLNFSEQHLGREGPSKYYISIGFCGGVGMAGAVFLLGAKRYLQGDWKVLKRS